MRGSASFAGDGVLVYYIKYHFYFWFVFNFSSNLSTSFTFPLKEGKDFVGCYFLNPFLLCGEVPALLAMGWLWIVKLLIFILTSICQLRWYFSLRKEKIFNNCYFLNLFLFCGKVSWSGNVMFEIKWDILTIIKLYIGILRYFCIKHGTSKAKNQIL